MSDSDLLFAWANDQRTRAWSSSTAPIERADHDRWMEFNVLRGYPSHIVMMADSRVGSVGVVRFDVDRSDVMTYGVSVTVAPKHRGEGYGYSMLYHACHIMHDSRLTAEIRPDNLPSRRIFERCGFAHLEPDIGSICRYQREPLP